MGGKPVWMIGPACSSMKNDAYNQEEKSEKLSSKSKNCCEWLDLHQPASILYVSFGSCGTILPSQMMKLALGLEASNKAFIWVIRPPFGFNPTKDFRVEWLPDGFKERMREKKKIKVSLVHKWAPRSPTRNFISQVHRCIPQPLWLELSTGKLESRDTNHRLATWWRAVL